MHRLASAVAFLFAAVILMLTGEAQAQWYSSVSNQPPLYPYAVPRDQPYAVEVAPGTYVIQRPAVSRADSYARPRRADKPAQEKPARRHSKVDPALIAELRSRSMPKSANINTTKVVRDPPVVIETKRYVDDPPRVVERYRVEGDKPVAAPNKRVAIGEITVKHKHTKKGAGKSAGNEKRVIEADAEITILGPDRMNIRLFRKGSGGAKANASAN